MMTYANYSGSASQYIREYLNPNGTITGEETDEEIAALYAGLDEVFASDGGVGMTLAEFTAGMRAQG